MTPRALIIGGGIGGMTAAIALYRIGWEAPVFERAPELREVGAGISLWSNAVKALEHLGLRDAIEAEGVPIHTIETRTDSGKLLGSISIRDIARQAGAPSLCLHRADLLAVLSRALPSSDLHLDSPLTGCLQDAEKVTARFPAGREEHGDILIGADGLRSVVRAQLAHPAPLRYSGYSCWRGVAEGAAGLLPLNTGWEAWGRGARVGAMSLTRDRVYWYATLNVPEGGHDAPGEARSTLRSHFAGWFSPIPELIEATPETAILRHDLYDRKPMRTPWGRHRITLLGDAAHPMTPNLGQGACQAIEDAVVLARCLERHPSPEAALRDYETRRLKRTSRLVRESRLLGAIGQWENPLACRLRSTLMRATQSSAIKQLGQNLLYEAVEGNE